MALPGNLLSENQEGIETDASGWVTGAGAFVRTTARAHSGVASLQLTSAGSGDTFCYSANYIQPMTAGTTYTVYSWAYTTLSGVVAKVGCDWRTSGGGYISTSQSSGTTLTPNTWTQVITTFTSPASTAGATVYLPWFVATASGQVVTFDDMYFGIPPAVTEFRGWGIPIY